VSLKLEVQRACDEPGVPSDTLLQRWSRSAIGTERDSASLVIRIVNEEEMRDLNRDYRHQDRPTNVLSFPFEVPPPVQSDLLGDLVVCAPVVAREAAEQAKSGDAHWAHMVIHGILHLLGYDHDTEPHAQAMEAREIAILQALGYSDPYTVD
jgi:probable rRNA maturation factor